MAVLTALAGALVSAWIAATTAVNVGLIAVLGAIIASGGDSLISRSRPILNDGFSVT
tara:strand:+ start:231 stop:401 length:171 start_codon:yes stop_codon:yes gene_type:complete